MRVMVAPGFHLNGNDLSVAGFDDEIDLATFARLEVEQPVSLRRQLLGDYVFIDSTEIRVLFV